MPEPEKNSAQISYMFKWIMASLGGIVTLGGMAWAQTMYSETSQIKDELQERGNRITRLEANFDAMKNQFSRMESKIDKLLEGK